MTLFQDEDAKLTQPRRLEPESPFSRVVYYCGLEPETVNVLASREYGQVDEAHDNNNNTIPIQTRE